jgi:ferredoxin--NADP+ reductase/benzoate/toluate 1,2-dioxygenase reductase subunit
MGNAEPKIAGARGEARAPARPVAAERACRVRHVRDLSPSAYMLRFDRSGLQFRPGQYLIAGLEGRLDRREYTIYSGPGEDYLEILVKEIEGGLVSRALRRCRPGDVLAVQGPFGCFTIEEQQLARGRFLFVASGTGVSPFHCFASSYPGLNYRLLHGVRSGSELYDREVFVPARLASCLSREAGGDYRGRVTAYLREHPVDPESLCYLCGSCDMIYEAFDILRGQGVQPERLFAEVYY